MKKSPLHGLHAELGARLVEFAGWEMPIQYSGVLAEHRAVREAAGIFDISHMGEFFVRGPEAAAWLNGLLCNDLAKLALGQGQYSLMLNEQGGVIDDLIVYRLAEHEFLLVVNASMLAEDLAWLRAHAQSGVEIDDRSAAYAALAIQGPESAALFRVLAGEGEQLPERNGIGEMASRSGKALVCRTGYTGEDGFELFVPALDGCEWMRRALELGAPLEVLPCGLGARDSLRLEMGYPLNGADLRPDRTPLQAGLGFFVAMEKGDFIGRAALVEEKERGLPARLAAIRMDERGPPPRSPYPVFGDGLPIGELCSGAFSPTLGTGIAMAYLPPEAAAAGTDLEVEIRGRRHRAKTVKKPFIQR
ncbi:MAG: glycine cleavage system aminomethyltransferase GcvT [Verrucomicrobiales bacterium]